jgi:hypothetical protein
MMTPRELADALENIDEEAFASLLLEFELNHDETGQDDDHRCAAFLGPARVKGVTSTAR